MKKYKPVLSPLIILVLCVCFSGTITAMIPSWLGLKVGLALNLICELIAFIPGAILGVLLAVSLFGMFCKLIRALNNFRIDK